MMYFDDTENQIAIYMFKQFYLNNMHGWIFYPIFMALLACIAIKHNALCLRKQSLCLINTECNNLSTHVDNCCSSA